VLGCSVWTRFASRAAKNGLFYGWTTKSKCMSACLESSSCVAVDVSLTGCVIHHSIADLLTIYNVTGVTQFVINRNCMPTASAATIRPTTGHEAQYNNTTVFAGNVMQCNII